MQNTSKISMEIIKYDKILLIVFVKHVKVGEK